MGKKKVQIKDFVEMLRDAVVKLIRQVKVLRATVNELKEQIEELEERISKLEERMEKLESGAIKVTTQPSEGASLLDELEKMGLPPLESPRAELKIPEPEPSSKPLPSASDILGELSLDTLPMRKQQPSESPLALPTLQKPETKPTGGLGGGIGSLPSEGMKEASQEEILKEKDELLKALEDLEII